ncbi:MAG: hypothetical protein HC917_23120 [Richelia sp. SM2_1_7]|nr:hypothetical protein [Richelia sp. SM2_1_7]
MATPEEREVADKIRQEIFDQVVVQYRIYQDAKKYRKMSKAERIQNYTKEREEILKKATKEILELKKKPKKKK